MTVHFNFTVSDEDAEVIMSLVTDAAIATKERSTSIEASPDEQRWLAKHAQYLHELCKRMTNTRVLDD